MTLTELSVALVSPRSVPMLVSMGYEYRSPLVVGCAHSRRDLGNDTSLTTGRVACTLLPNGDRFARQQLARELRKATRYVSFLTAQDADELWHWLAPGLADDVTTARLARLLGVDLPARNSELAS